MLPSLGIEVVYNAQGVGVKASKHESKKLLKKFRETEHFKAGKKATIDEEREMEEDLMIPRALSYHSYQRELHHVQKKQTIIWFAGEKLATWLSDQSPFISISLSMPSVWDTF